MLPSTLQRFRRRFISGLPGALENLENHTQKVPCMEKWNFVNEFVLLTDDFCLLVFSSFNSLKIRYAFLNALLSGCCCILQTTK